MTTSDNDRTFRYVGNASTDTFSFPARIFSENDLVVEIITRATDALADTLTITTDYTVTISGDESASITTVAGKIPTALQDIQLRSSLAQTQTVDLPTGTVFPAKSVEDALDRVTVVVQEVSEDFDRAITLPVTSSLSDIELATPVASEVIGWDSAGTALTSYAFGDLSTAIDTTFTSLADNDLLQYDSGTTKWVNATTIGAANLDINSSTDTVITAADEILFGDVTDSNNVKKDTVQGILDLAPQGTVVLGSYTASAASTVTIGSGLNLNAAFSSTYDKYILLQVDVTVSTDGATQTGRTTTDGGSTWDSGAGAYSWVAEQYEGAGFSKVNSLSDTSFSMGTTVGIGSTAGESFNGALVIHKPTGTNQTLMEGSCVYLSAGGIIFGTTLFARRISAADIDGIQITPSAGTISGTYYLIGVSKS